MVFRGTLKIKSRWEITTIGELCELKAGSTPSRRNNNYWNNGTIKWLKINDFKDFDNIINTDEKITKSALKETGVKLLPKDTIVVTIFATIGRVGILKDEMTTNQAIIGLIIKKDSRIINYYLMYIIKYFIETLLNQASGSAQSNINGTKLSNLKIPLPPLNIQKEIIKECEFVDKDIKTIKSKIENELNNIKGNMVKIESISKKIFAGGDKPKNISDIKTDKLNIPIFANSVKEKGLYGFTDIHKVSGECVTVSARGTIGYAVSRNENFYPIVRLIIIIPYLEKIYSKYMEIILNFLKIKGNGAGVPQLTVPQISNIKIPLLTLQIQKEIVSKIEKLEVNIAKFQKIIDEANDKKQAILKKYL